MHIVEQPLPRVQHLSGANLPNTHQTFIIKTVDFHVFQVSTVTDRAYLPEYMAVRDRYITDPPPASTLMIVTGFAREAFLVEVEVIAAAAPR